MELLHASQTSRIFCWPFSQYEMEFDNVVRYVPKNRQYLLDHKIENIFCRYSKGFGAIRIRLNKVGIVYLGDFLQMSEAQFRLIAKSRVVEREVKDRLVSLEFDFGMKVPGWIQGQSDWRQAVAKLEGPH